MLPLPAELACPPVPPDPVVEVSVLSTGHVGADWRRVVDTGHEGPLEMPLLVGVLRHPDGLVLVDSGMGRTTQDGTYPRFPINRFGAVVPEGAAIVDQLDEAPQIVLTTHLHYDHVGGLLDLSPDTSAWVWDEAWRAYGRGGVPGFPARRMKQAVSWDVREVEGSATQQVLGRPAQDVLGDGSIWYIHTPGHIPGAASILVFGTEGPVLFVGDTAWVDAHLEGPRRPPLTTAVVDAQPRLLARSLAWARWLYANCPELTVVSGHEPHWVGAPSSLETLGLTGVGKDSAESVVGPQSRD